VTVAVDLPLVDTETVDVHVRVPGVRVPVDQPLVDTETVGVYVGVPGVRVAVLAKEIVLDVVYTPELESDTDILVVRVGVYVDVPGVLVAEFTDELETLGLCETLGLEELDKERHIVSVVFGVAVWVTDDEPEILVLDDIDNEFCGLCETEALGELDEEFKLVGVSGTKGT